MAASNRFGKTEFLTTDLALRAENRHPYWRSPKNADFWFSVTSFKKFEDTILPKLKRKLRKDHYHFDKNSMCIHILRGSGKGNRIFLKSAEGGVDSYEGAAVAAIYVDEEHPEDIWDAIWLRCIDFNAQIIVGCTLTRGNTTWTYHKLIKPAMRGEAPHILYINGTMRDNISLDPEVVEKAWKDAEKRNPLMAAIRFGGQHVSLAGEPFFSIQSLTKASSMAMKPGMQCEAHEKFTPSSAGMWMVYELPKEKEEYILSVDAASGLPNRNGCSIQVISVRGHEQVATFFARVPPEQLAEEIERGGRIYNSALVVVEAMAHGLSVIGELMRRNYPKLYTHDGSFTSYAHRVSQEMGWKQTPQNRTVCLDALRRDISYWTSDDPGEKPLAIIINDPGTVDEMTHFIIDKKGKAQAEAGQTDDRLMALAIGNAVFHQAAGWFGNRKVEKPKTLWQQWQDQKKAVGSGQFGWGVSHA